MPRVSTIVTNMTAGVWSPRLRGRVDMEKFGSSLRDASNVVVLKHGGVTARPCTDYLGEVNDSTQVCRLIPFVYSNTDSYVLEMSTTTVRVWKNGALVMDGVSPYEVANPYSAAQVQELDYVQSGDTLIMAHADVPLKRLRRFADDNWVFDALPLDPGAIVEVGARDNIALTLSAATVGVGRTVTAASAFWRAADVGRVLTSSSGSATITGYTSDTVVTAQITSAFAGVALAGNTWLLEGSPQCILVPSEKDPVGGGLTLTGTLSAFRSADIGAYVQINGGLCRITSLDVIAADSDTHDGDGSTTHFPYTFQILSDSEISVIVDGIPAAHTLTNVGGPTGGTVIFAVAPPATAPGNVVISRAAGDANSAQAVIVQELSSTTAAPADAWVLKHAAWNAVDGYPSTVTLYQQRLWAGNTTKYPQTMWASQSGLYFQFIPGSDDDSAVYKTADSRQATPIRFLHPGRKLIALSDAYEFEIKGGVEKPVTQTNADISKQSRWGCAAVKPEDVGDNVIFVQRGGKVLRSIYSLDVEGFAAKDISVYAEHLLQAGVAGMTFQQAPESVLWCWLEDGEMLAITYSTEQNILAIVPCDTAGLVESMCTVPEGDEDVTYLLVRRNIDGTFLRYVERFNWTAYPGMDCRTEATGGPTAWTGMDHLEDRSVVIRGDGVHLGQGTVASGALTTETEATALEVGLRYIPSITPQNPEIPLKSGTGQARAISVNKVTARLLETVGCQINGEDVLTENFDTVDALTPGFDLFTGDVNVTDYGWGNGDEEITTLTQPYPYPWTVLAIIREVTVNEG